ncbi:MAG TPA: MazG-like family protein [Cyclobacteriaceae bacterium]|nr:MazG-like family protein [Cyclobacteriaceae bacterium]
MKTDNDCKENPIEDQRIDALRHYNEASAAINHWKSFVGDSIKSYRPVFKEIHEERKRQDDKWGQQDHSPADYLMILGEEVGEANKAALEWRFGYTGMDPDNYRKELIQVAAVAVAMIESYDRTNPKP